MFTTSGIRALDLRAMATNKANDGASGAQGAKITEISPTVYGVQTFRAETTAQISALSDLLARDREDMATLRADMKAQFRVLMEKLDSAENHTRRFGSLPPPAESPHRLPTNQNQWVPLPQAAHVISSPSSHPPQSSPPYAAHPYIPPPPATAELYRYHHQQPSPPPAHTVPDPQPTNLTHLHSKLLFNSRSVLAAKARVYKKTRTPPLHSGVGCYVRPKLHRKRRIWTVKVNPCGFPPEFDEALCHLSMGPTTLAHTSPKTATNPSSPAVATLLEQHGVHLSVADAEEANFASSKAKHDDVDVRNDTTQFATFASAPALYPKLASLNAAPTTPTVPAVEGVGCLIETSPDSNPVLILTKKPNLDIGGCANESVFVGNTKLLVTGHANMVKSVYSKDSYHPTEPILQSHCPTYGDIEVSKGRKTDLDTLWDDSGGLPTLQFTRKSLFEPVLVLEECVLIHSDDHMLGDHQQSVITPESPRLLLVVEHFSQVWLCRNLVVARRLFSTDDLRLKSSIGCIITGDIEFAAATYEIEHFDLVLSPLWEHTTTSGLPALLKHLLLNVSYTQVVAICLSALKEIWSLAIHNSVAISQESDKLVIYYQSNQTSMRKNTMFDIASLVSSFPDDWLEKATLEVVQPLTSRATMMTATKHVCVKQMLSFNCTVANDACNLYSFDSSQLNAVKCVHNDHVSAVLDIYYSTIGHEFLKGTYDRTVSIVQYYGVHNKEIYHVSWISEGVSYGFCCGTSLYVTATMVYSGPDTVDSGTNNPMLSFVGEKLYDCGVKSFEDNYSEITILHSRLEAPLLCHSDVSELMTSLGVANFQVSIPNWKVRLKVSISSPVGQFEHDLHIGNLIECMGINVQHIVGYMHLATSVFHCFVFSIPIISVGHAITMSSVSQAWGFHILELESPLTSFVCAFTDLLPLIVIPEFLTAVLGLNCRTIAQSSMRIPSGCFDSVEASGYSFRGGPSAHYAWLDLLTSKVQAPATIKFIEASLAFQDTWEVGDAGITLCAALAIMKESGATTAAIRLCSCATMRMLGTGDEVHAASCKIASDTDMYWRSFLSLRMRGFANGCLDSSFSRMVLLLSHRIAASMGIFLFMQIAWHGVIGATLVMFLTSGMVDKLQCVKAFDFEKLEDKFH